MKLVTLAIGLFIVGSASARTELSSDATQTSLIELYTSEGCSSCPPADRTFSELRDTSGLWRRFVPVAFHVDYWNNIGWRDPMSSAASSNRQRAYGGAVATPALKINGEDTSGIGGATRAAGANFNRPGVIKVKRIGERRFVVSYQPVSDGGEWEGNVALLGFGIVSNVTSGENAGNTFSHDFVVLGHDRAMLKADGRGGYSAEIEAPQDARVPAAEYGVAAWVTSPGYLRPRQATGGMLGDLQITTP